MELHVGVPAGYTSTSQRHLLHLDRHVHLVRGSLLCHQALLTVSQAQSECQARRRSTDRNPATGLLAVKSYLLACYWAAPALCLVQDRRGLAVRSALVFQALDHL